MTDTDHILTEYVREAWRNACEGGYGDTLRAMKPEEIACDIIAYNDDVAGCAMASRRGDPDFEALERRIVAILPQVLN